MYKFAHLCFFLVGAEVCYNRIGCFNDAKPWAGTVERPITKLPWTPEKINTRFLLYTRSNQNSYQVRLILHCIHSHKLLVLLRSRPWPYCVLSFQVISATNPSTISSSNFSKAKKTRFVIHGFTDSGVSTWLSDICRVWGLIFLDLSAAVKTQPSLLWSAYCKVTSLYTDLLLL